MLPQNIDINHYQLADKINIDPDFALVSAVRESMFVSFRYQGRPPTTQDLPRRPTRRYTGLDPVQLRVLTADV